MEFLYIENLQLLVQQIILYQITPWNKRWLFVDICDIENMTYLLTEEKQKKDSSY